MRLILPHQAKQVLKQAGDRLGDIYADVRSFNFNWIVPYETAFSPRILQNPSTWVMLLFGFFPLLGELMVTSMEALLICLVVYFALAWAAYFYVFVANRTTDIKLGLITAGCTSAISVPMVLLIKKLPPFSVLYAMAASDGNFEGLLGFILGVGINEEIFKTLPVMLLAFHFGRIKKPLDGIFYGALSGLGFAIPEGYLYIARSHNAHGALAQMLLRTTTLPFLHATWTAIAGYFVALAVIDKRRRVALCVLGISVSAVLHGCYDFTVNGDSMVSLFVAAFVYLLFISYIERSQDMVKELEKRKAVAEAVMRGGPVPLPNPVPQTAGESLMIVGDRMTTEV